MRMTGGLGDWNYRDACRKAAINMIKEELDVADMVRVYRIMYGDDKVKKSVFWNLEEAREGPGRRRFREKEVSRTASTQRKDIRNKLDDSIKKVKSPKSFRNAYKKVKNLVYI